MPFWVLIITSTYAYPDASSVRVDRIEKFIVTCLSAKRGAAPSAPESMQAAKLTGYSNNRALLSLIHAVGEVQFRLGVNFGSY
jgi:hypothetical protein